MKVKKNNIQNEKTDQKQNSIVIHNLNSSCEKIVVMQTLILKKTIKVVKE